MIKGRIEQVIADTLHGWAWDSESPHPPLQIEVFVDGKPIGEAEAGHFRQDLRRANIGDGHHGFRFTLPRLLQDGEEHKVELRHKAEKGKAFANATLRFERARHAIRGRVERLRDGRVFGWAFDDFRPMVRLPVIMEYDGQVVGETTANISREDLRNARIGDGNHGFHFSLDLARMPNPAAAPLTFRVPLPDGGEPHVLGILKRGSADLVKQPVLEAPPKSKSVLTHKAEASIADLLAVAIEAERLKKVAAACEHLDMVLAREPRNFEALYRRARLATTMGELARAHELATIAMSLKPSNCWPAAILARIADARGQRSLALELWRRVTRNHSTYMEGQQASARMLIAAERHRDARVCLETVLTLSPKTVAPRRMLIDLLVDLDEDQAAATQCAILLTILPNDERTVGQLRSLQARQRTSAAEIIGRYRHVMSAPTPVILAAGDGLLDVILTSALISALSRHFGCAIKMIVPSISTAVSFVFDGRADVSGIQTIDTQSDFAEVAFVLPEYVFSPSFPAMPSARLRLVYNEMRTPTSADSAARFIDYLDWLRDLCGPLEMSPFAHKANSRRGSKVLLATHDTVWPHELVANGYTTSVVRLSEMSLTDATAAMDGAHIVICADEAAAAFAAYHGASVCHFTRGSVGLRSWLDGNFAYVSFGTQGELDSLLLRLVGPPQELRPLRSAGGGSTAS